MAGVAPITDMGILAWCQLTGTRLMTWEYRVLKMLDRAFREIVGRENKTVTVHRGEKGARNG